MRKPKRKPKYLARTPRRWPVRLLATLCLGLSVSFLMIIFVGSGKAVSPVQSVHKWNLEESFVRNVSNKVGGALQEGGLSSSGEASSAISIPIALPTAYTLNDYDLVAPEPNQSCFGEVSSAQEMAGVLEQAAELLQGQTTLLTTETQIKEGSTIQYYLDETIFAVTWKQVVDNGIYTFMEVKIAHASQFRRFFSEGVYGSDIQHTTTEMSQSVNAVAASSADFYDYREFGFVVNNGQVYRENPGLLETCYIDDKGDLLFTRTREIEDRQTLEKYIADNNIRFSIAFGPLLIQDGELCELGYYRVGQIHERYARAALCQLGELHYAVVAANYEDQYYGLPSVPTFARQLHSMGIPTAYTLDGGQTATIVMNDTLINSVSYGSERKISDIIYFATAIPESEHSEVSHE